MRIPRSERRERRGRAVVEFLVWTAAVGAVAGTIGYSLGPAPAALNQFPLADKLLHAAAYSAVTFTWLLAAVWRPGRGAGILGRAPALVAVAAVALGATIEVAQHYVDRTADPLDALADAAGAAIGMGGWALVRRVTSGP